MQTLIISETLSPLKNVQLERAPGYNGKVSLYQTYQQQTKSSASTFNEQFPVFLLFLVRRGSEQFDKNSVKVENNTYLSLVSII